MPRGQQWVSHRETGECLQVTLCALGAAVDLVRAADGVLVGTAAPAVAGQRTAGGVRRTPALPVRTQARLRRLLHAASVAQVTQVAGEPCELETRSGHHWAGPSHSGT